MNRHTKTALFVAPLLLVGGYILSDMYIENEASKPKYVELQTQGECSITEKLCLLSAEELKLNVYQQGKETWVNGTFALDRVTLFLVDAQDKATEVKLAMGDSPFYWHRETGLEELLDANQGQYKLRVVTQIKGAQYFAEFIAKK